MKPRPWIPLTLLAVFLTEVVVFTGLGNTIGFPLALLLVLATSLVGLVLLRREGLRAWRGFHEATAAGAKPGAQITDGLVGLAGALLLAAPGLVSGVAGAALLTPPLRGLARRRAQAIAERRMSSADAADMFGPRRVRVHYAAPHRDADPSEVIEGEIINPDHGPR